MDILFQKKTDKIIHLWKGFCPIHENMDLESVIQAKNKSPESLVLAHPECRPEVQDYADFVLSTGGMLSYAKKMSGKTFIVATENGMIHRLEKEAPENTYYPVSKNAICPNMKKINLESLLRALQSEESHIKLDREVSEKAYNSLNAMMSLS